MEKILEKISSYHLLNNLIPGMLFIYLLDMLGIFSVEMNEVLKLLFLGYYAGMVINRVGSVVVEPLFQTCKIVNYAPYPDYLKAEQTDKKLSALLADNNVYRTMTAMFLLLIVLYIGHMIPKVDAFMHTDWATLLLLVCILVLYVLAFRKQTSYIRKRVKKANNQLVE